MPLNDGDKVEVSGDNNKWRPGIITSTNSSYSIKYDDDGTSDDNVPRNRIRSLKKPSMNELIAGIDVITRSDISKSKSHTNGSCIICLKE